MLEQLNVHKLSILLASEEKFEQCINEQIGILDTTFGNEDVNKMGNQETPHSKTSLLSHTTTRNKTR